MPTIVVEFPSSQPTDQRRDYEEKKDEYRDIGVKEYWIIDHLSRTMLIYTRRGKRWVKRIVAEEATYRTVLLPGLELPLETFGRHGQVSVKELLIWFP